MSLLYAKWGIGVVIEKRVERPSRELVEQFRDIDTATIGHLWETLSFGVLDHEIRPIDEKMKVVGPAITARLPSIDNSVLHKAIDYAEPGDVLVISVDAHTEHACWGGLMSLSASLKGIAGVVVDGAVCDIFEIREVGVPVFARAVTARTMIRKAIGGDVNIPILCGGVRLKPGDLVIGDDSGVMIVPKKTMPDVLAAAKTRKAREKEVVTEMRKGRSLSEILDIDAMLRKKGLLR